MLYACINKTTKEPSGVIDLEDSVKSAWEVNYILRNVNDSFMNKQGSDMKYINNIVSLKTKAELDIDVAQELSNTKQIALDILGITENDLQKLKAL